MGIRKIGKLAMNIRKVGKLVISIRKNRKRASYQENGKISYKYQVKLEK